VEMLTIHLLPAPNTWLSLGSDMSLSTLFSNNLHLCSSRCIRDQKSHPYQTTVKIIGKNYFILYALMQRKRRKNFPDRM